MIKPRLKQVGTGKKAVVAVASVGSKDVVAVVAVASVDSKDVVAVVVASVGSKDVVAFVDVASVGNKVVVHGRILHLQYTLVQLCLYEWILNDTSVLRMTETIAVEIAVAVAVAIAVELEIVSASFLFQTPKN